MAGPPRTLKITGRYLAFLAWLFDGLENSLLFSRPFGPHFPVWTPFSTPKSLPKPPSGALFLKPQHRQTNFAKNCTPPKRKPHFCISRTFKNCSFFAKKSLQNRTFFATPLGTPFYWLLTSKNTFFWPNMEPNLGSKTSHFFINRHRETSKPPKTSQDPQNLLQDHSGTPPRLLQASLKRFQSMTFKANLTKSSPFLKFWLNNITLQHSEYSLGPIHWIHCTQYTGFCSF